MLQRPSPVKPHWDLICHWAVPHQDFERRSPLLNTFLCLF